MQLREQLIAFAKLIPTTYVGMEDGVLTTSSWPRRPEPQDYLQLPLIANAAQLQLGDEIMFGVGPWQTAIVSQIAAGLVHFFRPYGVTADFSSVNGVICYTGVEQFSVNQDNTGFCCLLVRRVHLK